MTVTSVYSVDFMPVGVNVYACFSSQNNIKNGKVTNLGVNFPTVVFMRQHSQNNLCIII